MFELNFNDGRYLPFEGTGAISTWLLEMPKATNPIDFCTISDVVIHMRYMCKSDKGKFKQDVTDLDAFKNYRGIRLFSVMHEFANQWYAFKAEEDNKPLELALSDNTFPPNVKVDPNVHELNVQYIYSVDSDGNSADVTKARVLPN